MREKRVDYSKLRLLNITAPEYRHLLLLLGWVGYFIMYFLTERLIPAEDCYPVHSFLDDLIPFNEWFVIPYVGWYLLIVGSLCYFLVYNVENFKGLQVFLIVTQVVAVFCYIVFPTRQDLRPEVFPRNNFLTDVVALLYRVDTNTGVCPSLHVAFSLGIASAWLKEKSAGIPAKIFVVGFAVLVCLSVVFIKQHSAVDIFAAIPVCIFAEAMAYGRAYWKPRWAKFSKK